MERIELRYLFLVLKDYAIELEIQRDIYRDIVVLTGSSQDPEKFSILDKIQKLYNKQYKTSIERLLEGYKREFGDNTSKEMKIRLSSEGKKKVNDLINRMPSK
jgi:hypothetical protein